MRQLWHFFQSAIGVILRHPVTGTSIIPVLPDGRIVLVQRRDTGRWSLPGGVVDWGEDIHTCVRRELVEETGLQLVDLRRLVGVYSAPDRDPRFHSICVVVEALVEGEVCIHDTLEIKDVKPFIPADIPIGKLSHDHNQHLQNYFQGLTTLA